LFGDWGLSGVTASSGNPVYLSLSAAGEAFNTTLWCFNGDGWSQITGAGGASGAGFLNAPDLTFDGTDYSFTLTGSDGTGLGFDGYDYAVVGTPALAADVNLDGRVDVNDLTIVLSHFGETGCVWSQGCIDGDPTGRVDVNDLTIVLANFGTSIGSSVGGISPVPEPSVPLLLGVATACLFAYARRRPTGQPGRRPAARCSMARARRKGRRRTIRESRRSGPARSSGR
jgi:hypothetical protein